jgi:hypothetical protein
LLAKSSLKDLLHMQGMSKTDKVLLCLAVEADSPKSVKQIKEIAQDAGLSVMKNWNVSNLLARSKGLAIRVKDGWELSSSGRGHISKIAGHLTVSPVPKAATQLRAHLATISDPQIVAFIDEAIRCLEHKLYRAAVVLSWVGAVSVLYEYIVNNHLAAFNAEATKRDAKWRNAKTRDDLARMKEADFLDVLEAISVIGKSVKQELKKSLDLRNGCGHPNSLQIGENMVAAHIETLILNVFSRFKI